MNNRISKSKCTFYGTYLNGRIASPQAAVFSVPCWNPDLKTITISEAYVYSSTETATNILSSFIGIGENAKSSFTAMFTFNSSYAGTQIRIVFSIAD